MDVGKDTFVSRDRVLVILRGTKSYPIEEMMRAAEEKDLLIDARHGEKRGTILVLDTGHVVLSPIEPDLVKARMEYRDNE